MQLIQLVRATCHGLWTIIASYCILLHHIASYCIILHHIASYCIIWHHIASYCIILHHIASQIADLSLCTSGVLRLMTRCAVLWIEALDPRQLRAQSHPASQDEWVQKRKAGRVFFGSRPEQLQRLHQSPSVHWCRLKTDEQMWRDTKTYENYTIPHSIPLQKSWLMLFSCRRGKLSKGRIWCKGIIWTQWVSCACFKRVSGRLGVRGTSTSNVCSDQWSVWWSLF